MPFQGSCLCLLDVTRAASFWQWTNYFELPHSGIGRFSCEGIAALQRRKSKLCSVNSFQGSSLQIDSCQENLFVLITVIVLLLKELKGLNLVESFPRHLCIVASLSSKPPQSPLAPLAPFAFLAPLLPCWVLICLWQSWHHHRSARSQFLTAGCRRNVKNLSLSSIVFGSLVRLCCRLHCGENHKCVHFHNHTLAKSLNEASSASPWNQITHFCGNIFIFFYIPHQDISIISQWTWGTSLTSCVGSLRDLSRIEGFNRT